MWDQTGPGGQGRVLAGGCHVCTPRVGRVPQARHDVAVHTCTRCSRLRARRCEITPLTVSSCEGRCWSRPVVQNRPARRQNRAKTVYLAPVLRCESCDTWMRAFVVFLGVVAECRSAPGTPAPEKCCRPAFQQDVARRLLGPSQSSSLCV
jgi:hypothetical protein